MAAKQKFTVLLLLFSSLTFALEGFNQLPQELLQGFSSGNAKIISQYFNQTVELSLADYEEIYGKGQAEIILQDFFKKNAPSSFTVIHKGGQEASRYAIGNLQTVSGLYRVTLLLKTSEGRTYIHQLRIEKNAVD